MSNDISSVSSQMDSLRWSEQNKSAQTEKKSDALTQEDFFSLLTQQLSFQDPSKPADNDQMISQMTNFTMAEGISGLNEKFDICLLYTSPSPRDRQKSRMPSSA